MRRWLVVILLCLAVGCGRAWYRRDADRDTYAILEERNNNPQWQVPYFSLNPNPASRLYDPDNPDYPPMPPDDPAAYQYMLRANGMRNYRRWHKDGDSPSVEDPAWRSSLPLDDRGVLVLNTERAVELAWLNSREYQTALEILYQQALTLTFVRFDFALHWMAGNGTMFNHFGSDGDETNTLTTTTTAGFTKNLAAGGQLLANFANSFIFQFAGPDVTLMTSNLTISLIQPLLQMAGRRFRMEPLTQSERNVLYAVRDFARFRKNFYVSVTTGGRGFLSLLLQVQNIRNQEASLVQREQNLRMHQALYETEQVSAVQVDQAFQDVLSARLGLLQAQTNLENSFDTYKGLLGLPPDIPIRLEDALLRPFQLTDPNLEILQKEINTFFAEYRELKEAPSLAKLREGLRKLKDFQVPTLKMTDEVQEEIERWRKQPPGPGESEQEIQRQRANQESLEKQLPELRNDLQVLAKDIDKAQADLREDKRNEAWEMLQKLIRRQSDTAAEVFVLQNQVRVYLIQLQPVNYRLDAAVQYARTHRLDLMNQQARVVDAWRQIAVSANLLRSQLTVTGTANLATPPLSLNPVGFSPSANSYTVGVQFNAPLNREAERNNYRLSLINYQLARRAYMSLDDQIEDSIRRDLRQLETDRLSFEISRRSLVAAARQVENAEQTLRISADIRQTTGTLDVLNAYTALLTAKNNLIGNWVSYETDRIQLLLDLEALQLDEREVPANDADDQSADFLPPPRELTTPGANATGLAPQSAGRAVGANANAPGDYSGVADHPVGQATRQAVR